MRTRSEGEMCDVFARSAAADGWVVYPETSGWDLVLLWPESPEPDPGRVPRVGKVDAAPGTTVGIEAKRRANVEVLAQCIDDVRRMGRRRTPSGPDFRGVLVPESTRKYRLVTMQLGICVYTMPDYSGEVRGPVRCPPEAERWEPNKRLWLPPVVPTTTGGGRPAPRSLTQWRVKALRLCALLRDRGYLTTADFREHGLTMTTWRDRWIVRDGKVDSRRAKYIAHPDPKDPMPDDGFEAERDELLRQEAAE